jgi:hypothetical protein
LLIQRLDYHQCCGAADAIENLLSVAAGFDQSFAALNQSCHAVVDGNYVGVVVTRVGGNLKQAGINEENRGRLFERWCSRGNDQGAEIGIDHRSDHCSLFWRADQTGKPSPVGLRATLDIGRSGRCHFHVQVPIEPDCYLSRRTAIDSSVDMR